MPEAELRKVLVGSMVCEVLVATGATSYTFGTGTLPPGLCFDEATQMLVFCPTTAGSYTFTINATNGDGTTPQSFTVNVVAAVPTWVTTSLGTIRQGVPVSLQLNSAPTDSYAITSGALPAGVVLSPGGAVSGTPSGTGGYTVEITATNVVGGTPQTFTGTVLPPVGPTWVTDSPLDNTAVGLPYSFQFEATGVGTVTYAYWSGTFPAGFVLSPSGVLSGTAVTAVTATFTIRATDANGSTNKLFDLTVDPVPTLPPAWTSAPTSTLWVSGDSTTDGFIPPANYGYYVDLATPAWSSARGGAFLAQRLGAPTVTYPGWTDATLGGLIPDYVKSNVAIYGNPSLVVVMGGTNDLIGAQADGNLSGLQGRMETAMADFDQWMEDRNIDRIWVTTPPIGDAAHVHISAVAQSAMNAVRLAFNATLLATHPAASVDTSSLANPDGTWQAAYDLGDGVHPSANGRLALAMLVQAGL